MTKAPIKDPIKILVEPSGQVCLFELSRREQARVERLQRDQASRRKAERVQARRVARRQAAIADAGHEATEDLILVALRDGPELQELVRHYNTGRFQLKWVADYGPNQILCGAVGMQEGGPGRIAAWMRCFDSFDFDLESLFEDMARRGRPAVDVAEAIRALKKAHALRLDLDNQTRQEKRDSQQLCLPLLVATPQVDRAPHVIAPVAAAAPVAADREDTPRPLLRIA